MDADREKAGASDKRILQGASDRYGNLLLSAWGGALEPRRRIEATADSGLVGDETTTQKSPEGLEPIGRLGPARIGDYDILNRLGEGGFGVVYRARKRGAQHDVQHVRIDVTQILGRASVMAYRQTGHPRFLTTAAKAAARLDREDVGWARAFSWLIRGSVAQVRKDQRASKSHLGRALAAFEASNMRFWAVGAALSLQHYQGAEGGDEPCVTARHNPMLHQWQVGRNSCELWWERLREEDRPLGVPLRD